MERKFSCPSCGAANEVTNPGILMKVCGFCKTAIYWDKESALRAGSKSMDLPSSSRFRLGATGKIKGESFTVLGRLHYAHAQGKWDEWFIEMSDGEIKWLSEDEGELFVETPLNLISPVPGPGELKPGQEIPLNDRLGVVEEIGEARCLGGEGQIPFEIEIGEVYPYVDGSTVDGEYSFGLEYDSETEPPRAFLGKNISPKAAKASPDAAEAPEEKVGEAIRCASCGKPYDGRRVETTQMVVCDACGAGLQLDEAEVRVVGKNPGGKPPFSFEVGTRLNLEKTEWEVMGRLFYVEVDEGIEYRSFEYVLYHPENGYLWLSEENGHFTISRPYHQRVRIPTYVHPKQTIAVGKELFKAYEQGKVTLRYVDGALPWTASVGEKTIYTHLVKPPEYIDREITGQELELFRGRYVDREEMQAALPKGVALPRAPGILSGVYSCQPYKASPWTSGMWIIGLVFVVVNLLLFLASFVAERPMRLLQVTVTPAQYSKEYFTEPFHVDVDGTIVRLRGEAPLNNSWIAAGFALVTADDKVVKEFWDEASFYHGRDSEGTWTEGSRSFTSYFKVSKAGKYRLLVHGERGRQRRNANRNEPLKLTLDANTTISWYFLIPMIFSGIIAIVQPVSKMLFEMARWSKVLESDDD